MDTNDWPRVSRGQLHGQLEGEFLARYDQIVLRSFNLFKSFMVNHKPFFFHHLYK